MLITSGDIRWSIYAVILSNTPRNYTKDVFHWLCQQWNVFNGKKKSFKICLQKNVKSKMAANESRRRKVLWLNSVLFYAYSKYKVAMSVQALMLAVVPLNNRQYNKFHSACVTLGTIRPEYL